VQFSVEENGHELWVCSPINIARSVFRSRIRIGSRFKWFFLYIRIQEGKNVLQKKNFIFCSAGCSLWCASGFWSCLKALYGGLRTKILFSFNGKIVFQLNCLHFWSKNRDLDPDCVNPDPKQRPQVLNLIFPFRF